MRRCVTTLSLMSLLALCWVWPATAQQATIGAPFTRLNNGFSEQIGIGWGINFPNGFFRFGGVPGAAPAGGAPGGAANFGFGFGGGGTSGFFNMTAGQSSQRSNISQSPSVTITNGGTGIFSDTTQSPFVIGVVPVVGDFPGLRIPTLPSYGSRSVVRERAGRLKAGELESAGAPSSTPEPPADLLPPPSSETSEFARRLRAAQTSTAGQADLSVAEIRRRQADLQQQADDELQHYLQRARRARAAGKLGAAKIYYQMALRRVDQAQREAILAELHSLDRPQDR